MAHARIGRYEVLRKIATGGMAELFLAKQVGMEGFEKVVAIKRILAHLAHDDEFINMFRDEARIVAKLSHPNIVQIYDLGKSEDTYFIAMEYIPGRNLSSVSKKARRMGEKLPPEYIARCIAQACEGLHYAHTRRDCRTVPSHAQSECFGTRKPGCSTTNTADPPTLSDRAMPSTTGANGSIFISAITHVARSNPCRPRSIARASPTW